MPPKFQSSFIPKGPTVSNVGAIPHSGPVAKQHDILSFIGKGIFALSIIFAAGAFGYKWYLGYSIAKMSAELDTARQEVATGVTGELIRLNDRIVSTEALLQNHRVLSPLFSYLESSTPRTVRFSEFRFTEDTGGLQVILKGAASTYAALATEADIIYKNKDIKNPVFSDLRLDEKGNVTFSLKAGVSPEFISYAKTVSRATAPITVPIFATSTKPVATSTATTTTKATSTPKATTTSQ